MNLYEPKQKYFSSMHFLIFTLISTNQNRLNYRKRLKHEIKVTGTVINSLMLWVREIESIWRCPSFSKKHSSSDYE